MAIFYPKYLISMQNIRRRFSASWHDLPVRYGNWKTVYSRFRRWTLLGVWAKVLLTLQNEAEANGSIDWNLHHVDSTSIRVHVDGAGARRETLTPEQSAQKQAIGCSRGGLTSKVHLRVGTGSGGRWVSQV